MSDKNKTKAQLIAELQALRQQAAKESAQVERRRMDKTRQEKGGSHRKQAEKTIQQMREYQLAINRLALVLGDCTDLSEIYHALYEHVRGVMDTDAFFIALYERERQRIRAAYAVNEGNALDPASLPVLPLAPEGRGIQSQVIRTGQSRYIPDLNEAWRSHNVVYAISPEGEAKLVDQAPSAGVPDMQSALYVPMKIRGETVGVIQVQSHRLDAYTQSDSDLLAALASFAAITVQNAQLMADLRLSNAELARRMTEHKQAEEEIRQRTAQLEGLHQVSLELTAELDLDSLLHSIASQAVQLLGGTSGGLHLYQPEQDNLVWKVSVGPGQPPVGTIMHRGEGMAGKVWETGKSFIVDDYKHWEGRAAALEGYPLTAVVSVPVRWSQEFLGVLDVQADPPRIFSLADAALLELLAGQAAIAIRNARLYEEVQAHTVYLETLQRIGTTLRSTLPLSQVLATIVQGASQALSGVGALIVVPDAGGERLVPGSAWGGRFLDAAIQFTQSQLEAFSLPLTARDNPIVRTFLTGDLQAWSRAPERIIVGVEPPISPELAPLIERAMGARLAVCVALPGKESRAGVLIIFSPREHLSNEERAMLSGLADQAGLAIKSARLFEEEREQRELAEALAEAAAAVSSTLDPDQVLDRILEQVERVVGGDAFNIMLMEDDHVRLARRRGDEQLGTEVRSAHTAAVAEFPTLLKMRQTGKPVVVSDTAADPTWVIRGRQGSARSYVGAPIRVGKVILGFLNVNGTRPGQFGPDDARRLEAFANHAATAIENAQLYSSLQESNAQLRTALQAKDEIIQNVSHELRTPLGLIYGYIGLLLDGDLGELTDEQKQTVQIMQRQGDRLRFMVERLLVLQALDASKLRRVKVDLGVWLEQAVLPWEVRADRAGIRLGLDLQPSLPSLTMDPEFLGQVIENLMDNAIKFTPRDGRVQVRAWAEESRVVIAVSDSGVGIPLDKLRQVFERFYQVDRSPTRRFGGMGIGLALCRAIVEAHGGRIWVESEGEGRGSTFCVALPIVATSEETGVDD